MNNFNWEKFTEMILLDARQEEAAILSEIEKEKKDKLEFADTEILNEVYHDIQNKINNIKNNTSKKLSDRMLEIRKELLEKRNCITNEVFDALKAKLKNFILTEDYKEYCLNKLLNLKPVFEGSEADITVSGRDIELFTKICKDNNINAVIKEEKSIEFGGFRLFVLLKKIIADETLDTKLLGQYESFEQFSGLYIE